MSARDSMRDGRSSPGRGSRALVLRHQKRWTAALAAATVAVIAVGTQVAHDATSPSADRGSSAPASVSGAAGPAPSGLAATADSYVVSAQPGANFGGRPYVFATTSANRAFLRFDTAGAVPQGRRVTAATLQIYVTHVATTQPGLEVHPAGAGWTEQELTAGNRPVYDSAVVSRSVPPLVAGHWVAVPIEPQAVSTNGPTSFELLHRTPYSQLQVASRESGRAPRLQLTLSGSGPAPTPTPTATTSAPAPAATGVLPIDVAPNAESGQSRKLAFAHYFPPYPVSLDNGRPDNDYYDRNYLNPVGEKGRHKAFGGLLRDRPLGRAPRSGDWRDEDLRTEVRQAIAAGLDGFAVDVLSVQSENWDRTVALMQAAHDVDPSFKIIVMPDMTATGKNASPDMIAEAMAKLARYPSAMRLADGRVVMSPFKAEVRSAAWWHKWVDLMRTRHGIRVALVPTFLNWTNHAEEFASISYGFSTWGSSNPEFNQNLPLNAGRAHAMGKLWAAPVRVQDVRPRSGVYEESQNTTTLRQSWTAAISSGADWVFLPTWNDYSEGTSFAPSAHHGWSWLDISSYYLTWWRTGRPPTVVRDGIYLTHRIQPHTARPTFPQKMLMKQRPYSSAPRDTVEALVFLKAPATVTLRVGGRSYRWNAPAGVSVKTQPLAVGEVSASVSRGGHVTTSVTSPYEVAARPYVQDLEYYAVSSLRR
jgi:Glycosyl hydrolase family 71